MILGASGMNCCVCVNKFKTGKKGEKEQQRKKEAKQGMEEEVRDEQLHHSDINLHLREIIFAVSIMWR